MTWKPTPKSRLIIAHRLDPVSGAWTPCEYKDLKRGDIFKAFAGDSEIDAISFEAVDQKDWVALCWTDPVKAMPPFRDKKEGYMIEVTTGPLAAMMKVLAS